MTIVEGALVDLDNAFLRSDGYMRSCSVAHGGSPVGLWNVYM